MAVPGTQVKDCFVLVPTSEPPYFGRQRCKFPAAPLAVVAPPTAEVASSTLGTGMHGVVRTHASFDCALQLRVPEGVVRISLVHSLSALQYDSLSESVAPNHSRSLSMNTYPSQRVGCRWCEGTYPGTITPSRLHTELQKPVWGCRQRWRRTPASGKLSQSVATGLAHICV
jgi:hypothetical protein